MTDLKKCEASDVLIEGSLQDYHIRLHRIHDELIRLNANLFVLDKLADFPKDYVLPLGEPTFLTLVEVALTHESVLIETKLLTDGRGFTIGKFHTWIRSHIRTEYGDVFDQQFPRSELDKAIKQAKKKLGCIRNNFIAHIGMNGETISTIPTKRFREASKNLGLLCNQINSFFDILCFDVEYTKLPLSYDPAVQSPLGHDERSDIEYILDLIVKDSAFYKQPNKQSWAGMRSKLPQGRIDMLNKYRRKFGEPDV